MINNLSSIYFLSRPKTSGGAQTLFVRSLYFLAIRNPKVSFYLTGYTNRKLKEFQKFYNKFKNFAL